MSKQQSNWKLYKDSWISTTPVFPGVWKRKEGGHVVREQAKLIQLGKYAPATMNTELAVLKVILKHAKIELGLRSNAAEDIASFDLSQHPTYSREEPNSLTAAEPRDFLAQMRADFPQHYAMTYCGLRPACARRRFGRCGGRVRRRTCSGMRANCWCVVRIPEAMSR
jgi:hypothetical protein